jgi:hypothetical protein
MNWTELLTSPAAAALYGFLGNTIVTYVLRNAASRNIVIVVLKAIVGALEKAAPAAVILLAIGLQGCAGTFDEAKLAGVNTRKATPPMAASAPARCQSLSERQYWFTGLGLASGAVGAAAGTMTLPVESKTVDTVLIVTTVAGGVGAASFGWFGANAGADYVLEGCGQ